MNQSADEARTETHASGTAVVCDPNAVNVRFLRAAMEKLGFDEVVTTRTADDLVHQAVARQAAVVVFDPAMRGGSGVHVIELLTTAIPDALIVAFCSDAELTAAVRAMGLVTVAKASMLQLDELVATVEAKLGRVITAGEEEIPAVDMDTPVWETVPSLTQPEPDHD